MCAGYIYIYEGVRKREWNVGRKESGRRSRRREKRGASQPAAGRPSTQETYS